MERRAWKPLSPHFLKYFVRLLLYITSYYPVLDCICQCPVIIHIILPKIVLKLNLTL